MSSEMFGFGLVVAGLKRFAL